MSEKSVLIEIDPYRWKLPENFIEGMRVPGEIIATRDMIPRIVSDNSHKQVANVATLPGIVRASLACRIFTGDTASPSVE